MRLSACVLAVFAVATVAFAPTAQATPIRYELTGTASGKIGGTTFTNATIDLVGIGDTANVQTLTDMGFTFYANPLSTFTIAIGGIGTATITDISEFFTIPQPTPGLTTVPGVVFGRTDNPPDLGGFTGIGFSVRRPCSRAVASPSRSAANPCAASWLVIENTAITRNNSQLIAAP